MGGSTESNIDRNQKSGQGSNVNPNQLVESMYSLQQKTNMPFDINTNEGRQLKDAGWLDDRGFIDRDGFNKFFGSSSTRSGGSSNSRS